jgi:hypothetical protein
VRENMKKFLLLFILGLVLIICQSPYSTVDHSEEKYTAKYIPDRLLEILSDRILNSTEEGVLKDMISHKQLKDDEITVYAVDKTVAKYQKELDEYGGYVLLVDADNDGIDDLFFLINDGGSMGNNSRILLKGNKDGTFQMTSDKMEVTQDLVFIKYKGKNYLAEISFDYDYKYYNGITIICFRDGIIYEKVHLFLTTSDYDVSMKPVKDTYKELAREATDIAQKKYVKDDIEYEMYKGDAEIALKKGDYESYENNMYFLDYNWFSSDVNNDGIDEIYTKGFFLTSTIHTITHLQNALITNGKSELGEYPDILSYYNIDAKGSVLIMFWISSVNGKNILNLIMHSGLDYTVEGYLIKGKITNKVYEVKFTGNKKVVPEIYTRGINYEDDENGWE